MRRLRLSPGLAAQHRRLDADTYDDVYVVGDVHGCRPELEALLAKLDPSDDDLVVFVGDLVRRGPATPRVVDLVRETPNFHTVRGNNEEKLLRGTKTETDLSTDALRWLRAQPAVISWDDQLVVHAGVDPTTPLADHTLDTVQNVESVASDGDGRPFWWERYQGPWRVFFGHKVLAGPLVGDHAVGLDTGCVYGGSLTAYDCTRERTVSVDAEVTYEDRPAHKFLEATAAAPTQY
jgi:serine/threonine protein phosphatase 1